MSIYAPKLTIDVLGGTPNWLPKCDSRSLFKDRFAAPTSKDETRKTWFSQLIKRQATAKNPSLNWLPTTTTILHAQLQYRLLVNLSNGVMENANIHLNRYGIPTIPGSAIKGCARRIALRALHDWIAAQTTKGSEEPPATDDACAPCCQNFKTPSEMLAAIARIFGWCETDWSIEKKKSLYTSDFAWAVHGTQKIIENTLEILPPVKNFAGSIAFLEATPNKDPGIELDVLTPHHSEYYGGKKDIATDTENPIPVYFPAVKAQKDKDHYRFPLLPLRNADSNDLNRAYNWLAHGLELLGIGAKTNAGYGWFMLHSEANQDFLNTQLAIHLEKKFSTFNNFSDDEKLNLFLN